MGGGGFEMIVEREWLMFVDNRIVCMSCSATTHPTTPTPSPLPIPPPQIDRLREEFLQEIELAQGELTTLREHISEVQLEAQILRSAAGLMVRPDELEAFARRTRAQQRKEEMRKVRIVERVVNGMCVMCDV